MIYLLDMIIITYLMCDPYVQTDPYDDESVTTIP